ncbi:hypothetical protein [Blastococcus capsensis]|nr:hypothetical protein [Blastococcus capsensis]MDK3255467.1 hypothetical protein [Blastococcus capsensis]
MPSGGFADVPADTYGGMDAHEPLVRQDAGCQETGDSDDAE